MNLFKFAIFLFGVLLVGCVPSLHQLYTDKDVVYDPKLIGVWKDPNDKDMGTWEFCRAAEPNSYKMIYTDKEKKSGSFDVHLVKLDKMLFLDVFPNDPNLPYNGYYNFHLLPVHTFIKINRIEPTLQMCFMDAGKFEKRLEKEPDLLKHEVLGNKQPKYVLTASTKELQKFMLKHADDEDVFGKPCNLKRAAPAQPNLSK
jgi:hypothetical protein